MIYYKNFSLCILLHLFYRTIQALRTFFVSKKKFYFEKMNNKCKDVL